MIFRKEHKASDWVFVLLTVTTILFVLLEGPIESPGTIAFNRIKVKVTSGYPLFMVVFKKLFGEHPYWPILFTQLVLVLSGIWVFTRLLINKLYANSFQESALVAILFYPIFDANIQVINHIISGAASYALYLVIIALLFNWMKGKQEKYFYYSLVLIVPLMMFRSQFIFLIAVLFFFEILKILKQKRLILSDYF